jgi:hypothetical protein
VERQEMRRYDLVFDDDSYGDAYFYAHPGSPFSRTTSTNRSRA